MNDLNSRSQGKKLRSIDKKSFFPLEKIFGFSESKGNPGNPGNPQTPAPVSNTHIQKFETGVGSELIKNHRVNCNA